MKNFNFTRFAHVLRWMLSERKELYTFLALGFFIIIFPTLVMPFINGVFSRDYYDMSCTEMSSDFMIATSICYYITCGAILTKYLGDKRRRITTFMLPASRLEKFAGRYLHTIVTLPLAIAVGFIIGDLLQMGVYQATFGFCQSSFAKFVTVVAESFPRLSLAFGDTLPGFIILFWFPHSLFLLAGTFFRRQSWTLSCILLFFTGMAVLVGGSYLAKYILDTLYGDGVYSVGIITTPWATALYTLAFLALIAFNYWAAFRIYSRMQAINNKFFNF